MKKRLLCVFIFFAVILCGCSNISAERISKIATPSNNKLPIQGEWSITKIISIDKSGEKTLLNSSILFSPKVVVINEYAWQKLNYKLKRLNAKDYTLNKYRMMPEEYAIKQSVIQVITVTSNNQYLCEIVKVSDNKAIMDVDGSVLQLEKISNSVDDNVIKKALLSSKNAGEDLNIQNNNLTHTGVLLGLSSEGKDGNTKYRTLWISSFGKKLYPAFQTEGIFFPRRSGFWKLEVEKVNEMGKLIDKLYAREAFSNSASIIKGNQKNTTDSESKVYENLYKRIVYICNDYVSFERTDIIGSNTNSIIDKSIQIQHVDKLNEGRGINIYDLLGEKGRNEIIEDRKEILKHLDNAKVIDNSYYDYNYGFYRKTGHWFLKGRIQYLKDNILQYKDFNINIIPPQRMIFFDDLCVPWKEIKDGVPNAKDAYTSPNKDIAIIITAKKVLVYGITNNKLDSNPILKLKLKKGEKVIMAEWVRGKYMMDCWNKSFLKNKVEKLN